jgi:hypothetical protein
VRSLLVVLALLTTGTPVVAQAPKPLEKIELIRLLTNPLFAQSEVAEVVRRSCVGFRPTERDWSDLRNAGAGGEVIASVTACDNRRSAPRTTAAPRVTAASVTAAPSTTPVRAPAPPPPPPAAMAAAPAAATVVPLTVLPVTTDVASAAGVPSSVRVLVHRDGVPQGHVLLTLKGTTALGLANDAAALTDDGGVAEFQLPAIKEAAVYRFEVLGNSGSSFPGRPMVTVTVRPAEPARLRVTPDFIATTERSATVVAAVTDSFGNPARDEQVELSSGVGEPSSVPTDSLGRATFTVLPGALTRGGALRLRVRTLPAVEVAVAADVAGSSGATSGFMPTTRRGRVGSPLGEPLTFRARTVQGSAVSGRVVRFRAVNARVTPDSAVLDSTGRVTVEVSFGARAGEAIVVARIDSVEKLVMLPVDPGPIVTLVLEYNGRAVTGKRIIVPVATPFVLRLTARDFYGNETPIDALGQMLRVGRGGAQTVRQSDLELVNLEVGEPAVQITLKARRLGIYDFMIGSGITASVRVEAIRAP